MHGRPQPNDHHDPWSLLKALPNRIVSEDPAAVPPPPPPPPVQQAVQQAVQQDPVLMLKDAAIWKLFHAQPNEMMLTCKGLSDSQGKEGKPRIDH